MRHPPVVLGIVGNPVSGRALLAEGVARLLGGEPRVTRLSIGDYRKYGRIEAEKQEVTEAHPAAMRLEIVEQHLTLLKRGEAIYRPDYNRQKGAFGEAVYVESKPFIIVEGELGLFTQGLRNNLDLRIFYGSSESVEEWSGAAATDATNYVESQRKWADLVIEDLSTFAAEKSGEIVLTLRPTLPRLALLELIQSAGEQYGVKMGLVRDMGLPVDRVEIDAAIGDKAAGYYQKRLIAAMPNEGRFTNEWDAHNSSAAQRLCQLLVVLHLLKAANG